MTDQIQERWHENDWIRAGISLVLLLGGLAFDYFIQPVWFQGLSRFAYYSIAYVPVGIPVWLKGIRLARKGEIFTEFTLMGIATIGAFYIREYPEGVAVMVFYAIGELFQDAAVNRVKRNIKALLDVRPSAASVFRGDRFQMIDPSLVQIGEVILVRKGERVALDGVLIRNGGSFNTSALTGESKPVTMEAGETVLAGMINEDDSVEVEVTKLFNDSSLSRILALVQNAQGRKAKTELLIRRFAKVYTPIVVLLAALLTFVPFLFVSEYIFHEWLYRALIFLVISCPCALVVAIPLGYFGGIGAGSRRGILFKGSSYLDRMTRVTTVVFDKTGTLTKGTFRVTEVDAVGIERESLVQMVAALEVHSTHPSAKAIVEFAKNNASSLTATEVIEQKGYGISGKVGGVSVVAGNARLFRKLDITFDQDLETRSETVVLVALGGAIAGHIIISDELKEDSRVAVEQLLERGVRVVMLSGDKQAVVDRIAGELGIAEAYGNLMPEDKVTKFDDIRKSSDGAVAFVGDGINDAPVLAISDVGIAMGGLGSDAAIETADVVIQTDMPSRIVTAIDLGKDTNRVVWQNITFAFVAKLVILTLGALGFASMWGAVFADVGVALIAIINSIKINSTP